LVTDNSPNPVPVPTDAELARRRTVALRLARDGWFQTEIAAELRVSQPTVSRWIAGLYAKTARRGRTRDDTAHLPPIGGRAPVLTDAELRAVFRSRKAWKGHEFAEEVERAWGVRYSLSHANALLIYLKGRARNRYDAAQGKTRPARQPETAMSAGKAAS
jgi:transposase